MPEHNTTRPTTTAPGRFGTKLSQHTRPRRMSGTKLSPLAQDGPIWRVLPAQGEFCTALLNKTPSRENFVPLSPPGSRAGRILYRTRGGDGARQHNNTPGTTGVKAPERSEEPQDPAAVPGAAGPGRSTPRVTVITTPAKVAHNFRRSFFETAQKRCNSNEVISMFEQVARELRAKLMGERPVGRQAASRRRVCPVSGRSAARGPHAASRRWVCPVSGRSAARGATRSITPAGLPG